MLERLFHTQELIQSPYLMTIYSAIVLIFAYATAYFFFPEYASILAIAFVTIAFTHVMHRIYMHTTKITEIRKTIWQRYEMIFIGYIKIFLSLAFVYVLIYVLTPNSIRQVLFHNQTQILQSITNMQSMFALGHFVMQSAVIKSSFIIIFLHNLEVLFGTIALSFLYGAGAIFILTYQASILGAVIGANILNLFGKYSSLGFFGNFFAFLHGSYISLSLLPYGFFEIGSYFLGAVAGGIFSAISSFSIKYL